MGKCKDYCSPRVALNVCNIWVIPTLALHIISSKDLLNAIEALNTETSAELLYEWNNLQVLELKAFAICHWQRDMQKISISKGIPDKRASRGVGGNSKERWHTVIIISLLLEIKFIWKLPVPFRGLLHGHGGQADCGRTFDNHRQHWSCHSQIQSEPPLWKDRFQQGGHQSWEVSDLHVWKFHTARFKTELDTALCQATFVKTLFICSNLSWALFTEIGNNSPSIGKIHTACCWKYILDAAPPQPLLPAFCKHTWQAQMGTNLRLSDLHALTICSTCYVLPTSCPCIHLQVCRDFAGKSRLHGRRRGSFWQRGQAGLPRV